MFFTTLLSSTMICITVVINNHFNNSFYTELDIFGGSITLNPALI